MEGKIKQYISSRYFRHLLFWFTWVFGFTFIKSFGEGSEAYLAWLTYYIVTLPFFVLHTYLIVYWAGRRFLTGWKWVIFILIFLFSLYILSYAEMYIIENFLKKIYPGIFLEENDYHNPVQVIISGIGNLYILLVFIASRQLRLWYVSEEEERKLKEKELQDLKAVTSAAIQPNMLLFFLRDIEQRALEKAAMLPLAISELSELLGQLMRAHDMENIKVDEEMNNVRRVAGLYKILYGFDIPVFKFGSEKQKNQTIPSFIVFSPLEILFRSHMKMPLEPVSISVDQDANVEIRIEFESVNSTAITMVNKELDSLFPGKFHVTSQLIENQIHLFINHQ